MGPTEEALALADFILKSYPTLTVDRIELAYVIDAWSAETAGDIGPDDGGPLSPGDLRSM